MSGGNSLIYLDNAASTWPKPPEVAEAVKRTILEAGANPGRGGHRLAREAEATIAHTRKLLATLLGIQDPGNLFFCLNATHALNLALKGILRAGDHLILSGWEHNAVARPAEWLRKEWEVEVSVVNAEQPEEWPERIKEAITPRTRLIATIHGSNVTGEVLPIAEIGNVAREQGVFYLVDASQSVGLLELDLSRLPIDLLAFAGHKGLFGPQGTGGLYAAPHVPLRPLLQGGTGVRSEELEQPLERPVGFESGTPNTPGIAGLGAGVEFVLRTGIEHIYRHEMELTLQLWEGLTQIEGVSPVCSQPPTLPVFSFVIDGVDPVEAAIILDQHYDIAVRAGFHCAALKHRQLGTERGAIRVSPGFFNTREEMERFIQAIQEIRQAFAAW
jgi:cysteine desulfurase family protein